MIMNFFQHLNPAILNIFSAATEDRFSPPSRWTLLRDSSHPHGLLPRIPCEPHRMRTHHGCQLPCTPVTLSPCLWSLCVLSWRYLWIKQCVDARGRRGGNTRGGTTKKREISRTLLSINLHFLVVALPWLARVYSS